MLRFAPRYGLISPCLRRPADGPARAANDNGGAVPIRRRIVDPQARRAAARAARALERSNQHHQTVLADALRLFAVHGHAAAGHAVRAATRAAADGDRAGAHWWAEVCHTLDRRQARMLDAALGD